MPGRAICAEVCSPYLPQLAWLRIPCREFERVKKKIGKLPTLHNAGFLEFHLLIGLRWVNSSPTLFRKAKVEPQGGFDQKRQVGLRNGILKHRHWTLGLDFAINGKRIGRTRRRPTYDTYLARRALYRSVQQTMANNRPCQGGGSAPLFVSVFMCVCLFLLRSR